MALFEIPYNTFGFIKLIAHRSEGFLCSIGIAADYHLSPTLYHTLPRKTINRVSPAYVHTHTPGIVRYHNKKPGTRLCNASTVPEGEGIAGIKYRQPR